MLEISANNGLVELRGIEPLTSAVRLKRIGTCSADFRDKILHATQNVEGT